MAPSHKLHIRKTSPDYRVHLHLYQHVTIYEAVFNDDHGSSCADFSFLIGTVDSTKALFKCFAHRSTVVRILSQISRAVDLFEV